MLNIGDLLAFQVFVRLCAGRVRQLLNLSSLALDCGITHNTARAWLSFLDASFLSFRLPPYRANVSKRLVKTPKLYFYDTGLVCALLGVQHPEQIREHPLRGALFGNWVVSQIVTERVHRGQPGSIVFYRERNGLEVDLVVEAESRLLAVECKSGQTVSADAFSRLDAMGRRLKASTGTPSLVPHVVYGGDEERSRSGGHVLPWHGIADHAWW